MRHFIIFIFSLISFFSYSQIENPEFQLDSISIKFFDTDSVEFYDYFNDQKIIDSISKNYSNWHRRAKAIESYQIDKYNLEIEIDGANRTLTLKNGEKLTLSPDPLTEEAGYTFEKLFLNGLYQFYRVQWYEGNNYALVNLKTGKITKTYGRVYINSTNTFLVSINDDIEAGYSANGIQLFFIDSEYNLVQLWKFNPSWGPRKMKWISENEFIVEGYFFDESNDWKFKTFYKKIKIYVP